jgi:hypothetical protein
VTPEVAIACKVAGLQFRPPFNGEKKTGPIPLFQPGYEFIGEVVGETVVVAKAREGEILVTALQVRVTETMNDKTKPGDIHRIYTFMIGGPTCERTEYFPFTIDDHSVGTRLHVIAERFPIYRPELRYRVLRNE